MPQKRPLLTILILLFISSLFVIDYKTTPVTTLEMTERAAAYLAETGKDTPIEPFHQDGCSLFPDTLPWHDFTKACLTHDIKYWAGGTFVERKAADIAFREEIAHTGPLGPVISWIAYSGVRLNGDAFIARLIDAEWGYGWDL